jgi:hypothetical protein
MKKRESRKNMRNTKETAMYGSIFYHTSKKEKEKETLSCCVCVVY